MLEAEEIERVAMTESEPITLVSGFRSQVEQRPNAPAMYFHTSISGVEKYVAITWGEFAKAADRMAAFLLDQGIDEQQHVAIWGSNRPEWHIADMATLTLRCRPVPVYLTLSAKQAGYVLAHSESQVAFVEDETLLGRVLEVRAELPQLRRIVVMNYAQNSSHDDFVLSWAEALHRGEGLLESSREAMAARAAAVDPQDVATLIYTSGTTGPPKAVLLTHANLAATMEALETFLDLGPEDRVLSYLPLAHIAERLVSEFRSYIYGNPVYFLDGIPNLGKRLAEVRPTQFFGVPRIWEKMAQTVRAKLAQSPFPRKQIAAWALKVGAQVAEHKQNGTAIPRSLAKRYARADRLVLSKIRAQVGLDQANILACGAAPIDIEVLRFYASIGLEICEVYGQTEGCGVTTINRPGHSRLGTVGTRLPGIEVEIAEDGEILARGGNVFAGYHKDPEATAETIVDGWLHTGDVGEFSDDGYLRITDRKKDLIITAGGKNISPSNIEGMIGRLDLVSHAVVIGDRRPFVSALITLDPEHESVVRGGDGSVPETVRAQVDAHMKVVNGQLSQVEQVKKWTILDNDFAIGEELTPTLKVKRKVVAEKYAGQIEALYQR
jgi:long-chain acyl-CoA synthetase